MGLQNYCGDLLSFRSQDFGTDVFVVLVCTGPDRTGKGKADNQAGRTGKIRTNFLTGWADKQSKRIGPTKKKIKWASEPI